MNTICWKQREGFTLIEMSIVLVIIGLIVGGILLGRDLIAASETRAQISQIEKYNSAVNTFKNKYGGLPGDLLVTLANQFGFNTTACTGTVGLRNGDGLIDTQLGPGTLGQASGETILFWQDLSAVNLIDGEYPNGGAVAPNCTWITVTLSMTPGATFVGDFLPAAQIGHGNYLSIYQTAGSNWYSMSAINSTSSGGILQGGVSIPVIAAYNIDKKMDDGLPTTGSVIAQYVANGGIQIPTHGAVDTTGTCYSGSSGTYGYSISSTANTGAGLNCPLSFRFQ